MSAAPSPESADSTSDSTEPDTSTCSSANPTPTGETCSEPAGPESPSSTTLALSENQRGELLVTRQAHQLTSGGGKPGQGYSAVAFLAKTSASPDVDEDSAASAADSSMSSPESQTLFDPSGYSSRTYPVSSLATAVGTSESCLERWSTSGTAWRGGFSTHVSSECRSADGACSSSEPSLTEILEPPSNVPARYSLSARAAAGILRRAEKRGRTLPSHLSAALEAVARKGYRDGDADTNYTITLASDPITAKELAQPSTRRNGDPGVVAGPAVGVRRLTPIECERLQGFPDDWTQLGETPDSRRYSALGDAVTVNVAEWIGRRL